MKFSSIMASAGLMASAQAAHGSSHAHSLAHSKRGFDCGNPVAGLRSEDCDWMSQIGFAGQGFNNQGNNGNVWVGTDGPNKFNFRAVGTDTIVVFWIQTPGDYESSFMNARQAAVTWSLPNDGDRITISVANGISGAFAYLRRGQTTLTQYGQVQQTWGEYTTGDWATVDVSREVYMLGQPISIRVAPNGCLTDMNTCVFVCNNAVSCQTDYSLQNCDPNSNPGAAYGEAWGAPSGGCQGWSNGGDLDIVLG